jgi:hypothetical protein
MADPLSQFDNSVEQFSSPIESLIVALGKGIAQAQHELDLNSMAVQEAIDTDPALSQNGLQAQWYQFPSATLNLKLALSVTGQETPPASAAAGAGAAGASIAPRLRIIAQPLSAAYQAHFNYDASAASEVNITIAPVPPPRGGGQLTARMTADQAAAAALASTAKFVTARNSQGAVVAATADAAGDALRFDVNFNPTAGNWYVLQSAPANPAVTPVVAAVDDATGAVRIISTPS